MGNIVNALQSRNASLDAAQEISDTGINVAHSLEKATGGAIDTMYHGMDAAQGQINNGLTDANTAIAAGAKDANTTLAQGYDEARGMIAPYQQAGAQGVKQLADFAAGEGSQGFKWDPHNDPGFQFRMDAAAKAMSRAASARGGLQGGGFAKALGRNMQDQAASEYQASFERDLAGKKFKQGLYGDLAGIGERANAQGVQAGEFYTGHKSDNDMLSSGRMAANDMAAGQAKAGVVMNGSGYIGDVGLRGASLAGQSYMDAAKARAASHLANANVWSSYWDSVNKALAAAAQSGGGGGGD